MDQFSRVSRGSQSALEIVESYLNLVYLLNACWTILLADLKSDLSSENCLLFFDLVDD